MPSLAGVMRALDALVMFRDAARRLRSDAPEPSREETGIAPQPSAPGARPGGQLEATLTNVVVAALKEAFDRDHARLELERLHVDEQRRRAEDTLRLEMRRQAADREVGRLRLLAGAALVGWIASVALLALRDDAVSTGGVIALALGWLFLLGSLGAAFSAQGRVTSDVADGSPPAAPSPAGAAALWLLIAGLAASAISLLL